MIFKLFNALYILNCKFQYKFKKFYQVFSIIASTCTGIQLIFIKNLEGVQFCRLILRLLKALFFLYCIFQNYTAIVQLKVTILKILNLKKLSGIFHYSLNLYRYIAYLLKIWKVYNYAD